MGCFSGCIVSVCQQDCCCMIDERTCTRANLLEAQFNIIIKRFKVVTIDPRPAFAKLSPARFEIYRYRKKSKD